MWPGPAPLARRAYSTIGCNTGYHGAGGVALARATGRTCGGSDSAMRGLPRFACACKRRAPLCCAALACQLHGSVLG
jgi:hypothetical protein